ncbi:MULTISPECIES: Arm DNA-binding domain-containing protein [unclassified Acinetobacter]|uniref:Arm DNA-binding domain-containing protein n=1 Tax=unclassified Acinetobacter TaxID=196816 RepID=UPI00211F277A|nr:MULTISPECIES: Arm DNA-binding domain-containing protein [unclassified Acinetobacter]
MKLTDTECRKAQPQDKRYRLSDENGLSLLVTPAGQKYWNVRYTVHGERNSESFSLYPEGEFKESKRACP